MRYQIIQLECERCHQVREVQDSPQCRKYLRQGLSRYCKKCCRIIKTLDIVEQICRDHNVQLLEPYRGII